MAAASALVRSLLILAAEARSGMLVVSAPDGYRSRLYLRRGAIVFADDDPSPNPGGAPLAQRLVREGLLTTEIATQLEEKIRRAIGRPTRNAKVRLGELAVELGHVRPDEIVESLVKEARSTVMRTFQREEVTWELDDDRKHLGEVVEVDLRIEALCLDAIRWMDDDAKLRYGLGSVLDCRIKIDKTKLPALAKRFELTDEEAAYIERIDENRTVRDLLAASHMTVDAHAILTSLAVTRAVTIEKPAGSPTSSARWPVMHVSSNVPISTKPAAPVASTPASPWAPAGASAAPSTARPVAIPVTPASPWVPSSPPPPPKPASPPPAMATPPESGARPRGPNALPSTPVSPWQPSASQSPGPPRAPTPPPSSPMSYASRAPTIRESDESVSLGSAPEQSAGTFTSRTPTLKSNPSPSTAPATPATTSRVPTLKSNPTPSSAPVSPNRTSPLPPPSDPSIPAVPPSNRFLEGSAPPGSIPRPPSSSRTLAADYQPRSSPLAAARASGVMRALEEKRRLASRTATDQEKRSAEEAFKLGLDGARKNRWATAVPELQRAADLDRDRVDIKLVARWAAIRARANDPPAAVERAELRRLALTTMKEYPDLAFGYLIAAEAMIDDGEHAQAHGLLVKALKLEPDLAEAQRHLRIVERRVVRR